MQSKKLEELRDVLPLIDDDKIVIATAAETILGLREEVASLQNAIDVLKQSPPEPDLSTPKRLLRRRRRWLF